MPTLHMITEPTSSLVDQMKVTHSIIDGEINKLRTKVNYVLGNERIASEANELKDNYQQWHQKMQLLLNELDDYRAKVEKEIDNWYGTDAILTTPPVPNFNDTHQIRDWWFSLLRVNGNYSSYAIFLLLPSDQEAIKYLKNFGKELDLISGTNSLIISFGDSGIRKPNFGTSSWFSAVEGHASKDACIKVANYFAIDFTEFPCIIFFNDIRSSEHIVLSLKSLTSEAISKNLRSAFSVIHKAIENKKNPVTALGSAQKGEMLRRTGSNIAGDVRKLTGKSIELMIEAFIKSTIKAG